MPDTMKSPAELRQELAERREREAALVQARTVLLRETIEAVRRGVNPNGARAKLVEADAEIDIERGAIEAVLAEIPEAEAAALADFQTAALSRLRAIEAEATPDIRAVLASCREMVTRVDALRSRVRSYSTASAQASGGKAPSDSGALESLIGATIGAEATTLFKGILPAVESMRVLAQVTESED